MPASNTIEDAERVVRDACEFSMRLYQTYVGENRTECIRAAREAYLAGYSAALNDMRKDLKVLANGVYGAHAVREPRAVYADDNGEEITEYRAPAPNDADAEPLADVVGILTSAGMGPTPPSTFDVLRACKPSPALVRLLVDNANLAMAAGEIDDACTMLSLALCARSAWTEGRALG